MMDEIEAKIEEQLKRKSSIIVAIDGMCAAGKTTLALNLKKKFQGEIIPMDAFFLPKELRTKERYQEPGGNLHVERFIEEVMIPLSEKKPVLYRKFHCQTMEFSDYKEVPGTSLYLIEGTYSMRQELRKLYDLSIFLHCSKEEQARRIQIRNGEKQAVIFQNKWIPLENVYFKKEKIKKYCDIVKNTGGSK